MTTYSNNDETENLPKKTDPLTGRKSIPPVDETPPESGDADTDPLQELRQRLHSEDQLPDSGKNDIFTRVTGTLSNRKSTQRPKDVNDSEHVFGVRTAGNTPFEPTDRQEPESDWTRNTVILQNAPTSEPFVQNWPKTRQPEFGEGQDESARTEGENDDYSQTVSKVRPIDPNEQEAAWQNYSSEQSSEQKPPASFLEEKRAQAQGDRRRLPSGFDRKQQVSRYISYNPKRTTREQYNDLSKVEKTLLFTLAIAVVGLISLIAYLFIMSRQPGFGSSNRGLTELTPSPIASPPVPVGLRLTGGWSFELGSGIMVDGKWNPTKSEWLIGTEVRRVVALPWNKQIAAVVQTFEPGDLLDLEMSNGDSFTYKVLTVSEIAVDDTSILYDIRPTLAIILNNPEAEKRWVVVAEPQ
jgi:hypothetical protein